MTPMLLYLGQAVALVVQHVVRARSPALTRPLTENLVKALARLIPMKRLIAGSGWGVLPSVVVLPFFPALLSVAMAVVAEVAGWAFRAPYACPMNFWTL